jgi:hypothetical protein
VTRYALHRVSFPQKQQPTPDAQQTFRSTKAARASIWHLDACTFRNLGGTGRPGKGALLQPKAFQPPWKVAGHGPAIGSP